MNLNDLATEMKVVAAEHPINIMQMMHTIETRKFPDQLKRVVEIEDFGLMHVQYTHDMLTEGKYIRHLSFSREDLTRPSEAVQEAFRKAFFGEEGVLPLPSMHPHVVQMGALSKNS
jgi:hypothetical protein